MEEREIRDRGRKKGEKLRDILHTNNAVPVNKTIRVLSSSLLFPPSIPPSSVALTCHYLYSQPAGPKWKVGPWPEPPSITSLSLLDGGMEGEKARVNTTRHLLMRGYL